jgi:hypothetical protein
MTINMTSHVTRKVIRNVAIIAAGAALSIATVASEAQAAILTQWDFNFPPAGVNSGTLDPSIGSGTASRVGGTTYIFSEGDDWVRDSTVTGTGSTDPLVGDDSSWDTTTYPDIIANNKTAGVQFKVSTVGQQNIKVSFDQGFGTTSSKYAQFQYSLNGINFVDFGTQVIGAQVQTAGDAWSNNNLFDLSSIAEANNNVNFAFRIVAAFKPNSGGYVAAATATDYIPGGRWRFDMATVSADAIPTPALLPGLVGLGLGLWRRQKLQLA